MKNLKNLILIFLLYSSYDCKASGRGNVPAPSERHRNAVPYYGDAGDINSLAVALGMEELQVNITGKFCGKKMRACIASGYGSNTARRYAVAARLQRTLEDRKLEKDGLLEPAAESRGFISAEVPASKKGPDYKRKKKGHKKKGHKKK